MNILRTPQQVRRDMELRQNVKEIDRQERKRKAFQRGQARSAALTELRYLHGNEFDTLFLEHLARIEHEDAETQRRIDEQEQQREDYRY